MTEIAKEIIHQVNFLTETFLCFWSNHCSTLCIILKKRSFVCAQKLFCAWIVSQLRAKLDWMTHQVIRRMMANRFSSFFSRAREKIRDLCVLIFDLAATYENAIENLENLSKGWGEDLFIEKLNSAKFMRRLPTKIIQKIMASQ